MALTIAEANGWNHLVRFLTGQSDQEEWALEAGQRFTAGAQKKLMAGLGEREFESQVWPQLVKLRNMLADLREAEADVDAPVLPVFGVAHPSVITVPITSWSVANATHDALPEDAELVVRLDFESNDQWLRYEDGAPVEARTW